eukprot:4685215-Ditylum_brightwellii.AAC.1
MEKLCFLNKLDSELNLIQREFITRQTMKHSEQHKYLADKQNGGREGRTSIDVVALKQFTAEVHHYQ